MLSVVLLLLFITRLTHKHSGVDNGTHRSEFIVCLNLNLKNRLSPRPLSLEGICSLRVQCARDDPDLAIWSVRCVIVTFP